MGRKRNWRRRGWGLRSCEAARDRIGKARGGVNWLHWTEEEAIILRALGEGILNMGGWMEFCACLGPLNLDGKGVASALRRERAHQRQKLLLHLPAHGRMETCVK